MQFSPTSSLLAPNVLVGSRCFPERPAHFKLAICWSTWHSAYVKIHSVTSRSRALIDIRRRGPFPAHHIEAARQSTWCGAVQIVRFAGGEGSTQWYWTVDLQAQQSVRVQACAAIADLSRPGHDLAAAFPAHVSLSYITNWCLTRTFAAG